MYSYEVFKRLISGKDIFFSKFQKWINKFKGRVRFLGRVVWQFFVDSKGCVFIIFKRMKWKDWFLVDRVIIFFFGGENKQKEKETKKEEKKR